MEYDIICCWNMDIEEGRHIQRLQAFEMWIWRRVMKLSWTEHRSNQVVLDMVGENRGLINSIRQTQKNWLMHVLRDDSLRCTVLEGRLEGREGVEDTVLECCSGWRAKMRNNNTKRTELAAQKNDVTGGLDLHLTRQSTQVEEENDLNT